MRSTSFLSSIHKVARDVRRVNSAVYGMQAIASGNPKRMLRWGSRKVAYRLFAHVFNRI
jgi:hypothetical protein